MAVPTDKLEFYMDEAKEHRWRLTAKNGEIVGASSEGYKNKKECWENALRVTTLMGKK